MNGARWLAQGAMGWCNMLEDWIREGGALDPSTAETLRAVNRRLDKVINAQAAQADGSQPPTPPPPVRRRAARP